MVAPEEAAASVATTLYTAWRNELRDATVSAALRVRSLSVSTGYHPWFGIHHLLSQEPFTGVAASGVGMFPEAASLLPAECRGDARRTL